MNELALFAGAGGGILGGKLLGWRTVCAVEWEPYPASVLCARQNDGLLPAFPIWDDIQTFDGRPWRGIVDVVSGGFPCQDISAAGKGAGIDGERSGMWREMARVIREVRPRFVFVENSPMLTSRGLGTVLGDLAELGFDARWGVLGAADVGAPHQRDRIWVSARQREVADSSINRLSGQANKRILESERWSQLQSSQPGNQSEVGHSNRMRESQPQRSKQDERGWIGDSSGSFPNSDQAGLQEWDRRTAERGSFATSVQCNWWDSEPELGRVAHGVAGRVDRLKAIGNGQVPLCAATAWRLLSGC